MVRMITVSVRIIKARYKYFRVILRLEFEILMDDHDLVQVVSICVSVTVSNFVVMWQPLSRYNVLGARGPSTSYGKTFCELS